MVAAVVGSVVMGIKPKATPLAFSTPRARTKPSWAIADALVKFAESRTRATSNSSIILSSTERAIKLLENEYADILMDEEIATAFEVMENDLKAKSFCAMSKGAARNIWLKKQMTNFGSCT